MVVHIRAREEGFIRVLMRCWRDVVVVFVDIESVGAVGDEIDMMNDS